MTSRNEIEETIRSAYAARIRGDLEGVLACFAKDAVFEINGRGSGVEALSGATQDADVLRTTMKALMDTFHFDDWKEIALLVDGENASLHWRALVTNTATKKADVFDVFDFITVRDGKISKFLQSFDTALAMSLSAL
jgi:ketosteroid isomerase-like protein